MKSILLVDDDFLVRSYLSQLIDWEANGYMLAGMARDGSEALEMTEKLHPDLVVADIDMPVMNGIELLQEYKKWRKAPRIVMLSCHDDFEYVKEAMKLGADEYLLKDAITPEKLLHVLQELLPEGADEENNATMTEEQVQKQLLNLLEGTALSCEVIAPNAVLAVRLTDYEETMAYQPLERREKFYQTFVQTCESVYKEGVKLKGVHVRGGLFAVLCEFVSGVGKQRQQLFLQEVATTLLREAERHFDLAVKIGVSDSTEYSTEIAACWNSAKNALGYAFYQRESIFYVWQYRRMGEILPRAAADFLRDAEDFTARRDRNALNRLLQQTLDAFLKEQTREDLVAGWLHRADRKLGIETRPMPKTFDDLREMVQVYTAACEEMLPDTEQYSEGVADTICYLKEHYREDISLSDAARAVHLTTTYLSYVFHKETGITFSEYLQSCRINRAKDLLEHTEERVREIGALVGYRDNRHFSKVFKKATGVTPQEYRREQRKQRQ